MKQPGSQPEKYNYHWMNDIDQKRHFLQLWRALTTEKQNETEQKIHAWQ